MARRADDALTTERGTPNSIVARGLAPDAIIRTTDGELPIQYLSAGDRVITRDTGTSIVKSIRSAKVTCRAIALAAGSLGHTRPDRDVILPADQQILIRDWRAQALFGGKQAMVPISRLIDGEYVSDMGEIEMILFQIEFDAPHVIYADGLEVYSTQPEFAETL
ncbi:MAG: Hint domain-containing protein [Paracoccaceae bacterium]